MIWCQLATMDCELRLTKHISQLPQNAEGTVRPSIEQDPATDQATQHQRLHVHHCWTANCDVIFGNWVKTYLQTRSHRIDGTRQNCSVSAILRTTENCRRLSRTQFTRRHRQDKTTLSCLVGVGGWTRQIDFPLPNCRPSNKTAGHGCCRGCRTLPWTYSPDVEMGIAFGLYWWEWEWEWRRPIV